ncbi:MAG: Cna B-type domain-containing protein [Clostridia bacterium]|nr:Cna B-type domain-containing protein [Clostridia bacterium]
MSNIFKRLLAFSLTLATLVSIPMAVIAAESESAETVWNGDKKSVDVKAGKNGYTFLSVYGPAYEMSNHMVSTNGGVNNDIPQTLILVDASEDYTWTPNGKYVHGEANYEVLYCCDAKTGYNDGIYYKRMNLEDSAYYNPTQAEHIRAIVTNAYPYVSLEEMKANLKANGFEDADALTRADVITAVQAAIWAYANTDAGNYIYSQTFDIPTNSQWGTVMHDYTNEMDVWWQTGKRKFSKDAATEARINSLIEYLKGQDAVPASPEEILITSVDIVTIMPIVGDSETYSATVRVALNNSGSGVNDNIKLDVYVDGELAKTVPVNQGTSSYDVTVDAKIGQTVKAVVSGTQDVPSGVYFYEPEGGRDVSQCLVGIAYGKTNIYAESAISVVVEKVSISGTKTWDDADNQDGKRPESITIRLWADGEEIDHATVKADENGDWTYSFEDLLKYNGDELIEYTITEDTVEGYETVVDNYNVTNTYVPEVIEISVSKVWDDDENSEDKRPGSIFVNLYADGVQIATQEISAEDNWAWTFTNLAKYEDGVEIVYTVSEVELEDYLVTIEGDMKEGFVLTNTYVEVIPETTPPLNPPPTGDVKVLTASIAALGSLLLAAWVVTGKKKSV